MANRMTSQKIQSHQGGWEVMMAFSWINDIDDAAKNQSSFFQPSLEASLLPIQAMSHSSHCSHSSDS